MISNVFWFIIAYSAPNGVSVQGSELANIVGWQWRKINKFQCNITHELNSVNRTSDTTAFNTKSEL